jgi:hypothetical protein
MSDASTASCAISLLPSGIASAPSAVWAWLEHLPGAVILMIFVVVFSAIFVCTLAWLGRKQQRYSAASDVPSLPMPPAPIDAVLYVGSVWNISADFTKIKDGASFTITIHISNQTDKNIAIESIRGNLIFERWTLSAVSPPENMPVIAIARHHDGAAFTIRQDITKEQQDRIREVLESGGIVKFDFSLIRFLIRVDSSGHTELISLQNLDNITCRYAKDGDVICGKDVSLSAHGAA